MKLATMMIAGSAAIGAVQAARNRPPLPFNDPDFAPTHESPVLYIHGVTSRSRAFRPNAERLRDEGFWVWGYDYGDMFAPGFYGMGNLDSIIEDVHANVDHVLEQTGAKQLDIVAHSQGGLMTKLFIANGGAPKVRRVVAMGANFHGTDVRGRATRFAPLISRYPRAASTLASPGVIQQLADSPWVRTHLNVPDTYPEIVYTSLYSPADVLVTPNETSMLASVSGADVVNINVAEAYGGYAPRHALMERDPLFIELTLWGLTRERGEHTPPRIPWAEEG
ncbi:alpha/beta hydrolase [Corynebacterium imitans]|uniref:esterase/lipase family protein n=1 Tax=Corynebacterium imitans TaxID=156978 RepID=UPI001EF1F395|nr:alpha/beta fold hydrolase [Corynebacterium imitans]MCG7279575.1 alpha/beta hydrolase [Corynebacterium imitans]MDK8307261.1 alpha/beta hydrolase [Corynebacterium imitans]MDK8638464.1 alpha/beta hydrolase [Corynebacterium imitans]MDK8773700.1 alpha/beta hydrolase [Corynebacterium imitans]